MRIGPTEARSGGTLLTTCCNSAEKDIWHAPGRLATFAPMTALLLAEPEETMRDDRPPCRFRAAARGAQPPILDEHVVSPGPSAARGRGGVHPAGRPRAADGKFRLRLDSPTLFRSNGPGWDERDRLTIAM